MKNLNKKVFETTFANACLCILKESTLPKEILEKKQTRNKQTPKFK